MLTCERSGWTRSASRNTHPSPGVRSEVGLELPPAPDIHRSAVKATGDGFKVDEFVQVFLGAIEALLKPGLTAILSDVG